METNASEESFAYRCLCAPGYEGTNCETLAAAAPCEAPGATSQRHCLNGVCLVSVFFRLGSTVTSPYLSRFVAVYDVNL